VGELG